ncbi:MAG: heat-inducible transcription repressor HrcA [Chloroflexi bacterium]|nr:heat-inducible transcription repressor HrcA [Chloroflexota bacterium]
MLTTRAERILRTVIDQYISKATPVSSQNILATAGLGVCSATVRNEVVALELEGYLTKPHHSAGSIPTDRGYRYYVATLQKVELPAEQQVLISHLFHQVELRPEEWLSLAVKVLAQLTHSVAVVAMPRETGCNFKHVELVALRPSLVLVVLVLRGARVRQQLLTIDEEVTPARLTIVSNKLNEAYAGLTAAHIKNKKMDLSTIEQKVTDSILKMMQAEDEPKYEESHLDGWHFMLDQPEFAQTKRLLALMELAEHRNLLKTIIPRGLSARGVRVVIGKENEAEAIHDYSVVISRYGSDEAVGAVGVVGPTRMPYGQNVSTVEYLAALLSELVAELYGRERRSAAESN